MRGLDIVVSIGANIVAAQESCNLTRGTELADVTNKITLAWRDYLAGCRTWSIQCNGAYVVNDTGLALLESAFVEGNLVHIKLSNSVIAYEGDAIITSFPIGADFNLDTTYSLVLQGKGALEKK